MIFPPEWKNLDEAKGLVISDYQNYLEGEWIYELKNTYEIKIDKKVLNKVYQKIEN
jgi:peptidyl-prolyl cis-trans isomerase SurA